MYRREPMNFLEGQSAAALELEAPVANGNDERSRLIAARLDRAKSFGLVAREEPSIEMTCFDVRGFREAFLAAIDPRAWAPTRLVVLGPDEAARAWLEAWSEDGERVHRAIKIARKFDGRDVTIVATLASYGYGVETSLAVESIRSARGDDDLYRSGVHSIVEVEAALAKLGPSLDADPQP